MSGVLNLVGYGVWEGLAAIEISVRALAVLQALNAFFAAATVCIVWRILYEFTKSIRRTTELAALFAVSATWWRFATDADAYIPSVLFLVCSFWFLLPGKPPRPIWVAVLHTVAMLFHQLALFFLPVAVASIWRQGKQSQKRERAVLQYASLAAVLTTGSYFLAFKFSSAGSFWQWITTHSNDSHFSFELLRAVYLSLRGMLRLFFGGKSEFWDMDVITITGTVLSGILIILLIASVARLNLSGGFSLRPFLKLITQEKPLVVWIFSYTLFLMFWLPQNTFYRLFYLPPLLFLAALVRPRAQSSCLTVFVALMLVWNFTFLIYPYSRTDSNKVLAFAQQRRHDWASSIAVAYSRFHSDLWTISYFNPQVSWIDVSGDAKQLETLHAGLRKRKVSLWLDGSVYDALNSVREGRIWLQGRIDKEHSIIYKSHAHDIRFYRMSAE